MAWATALIDWSTVTLPFRVTAAVLKDQLYDKLTVLNQHQHTGGAGEGSAALAPTSITMGAGMLQASKGADLASATALALGSDGNYFNVTGAVTISSISAKQAGTLITLRFAASPP